MKENKSVEEKKKELEAKQDEEVLKVVASHNNTFEKEYEFKELGLKFRLKLKFPTLIDQARVASEVEREFQGLSSLMNQNFTKALYVIKMISYQQNKYSDDADAIYIPEFLRKPEEVYNPMILATIANDYQEWMDSFRY